MKKILFIGLMCLFCASGWAAAVENSVVVEIDTLEMSEENVENIISDPIQVLLGSLEGVYLVSAKYRTNKAIINVRFSETSADPDTLLTLVKITIDSYLDQLPNDVDSISVSLGDSSGLAEQLEQDEDAETKIQSVDDKKLSGDEAAAFITQDPEVLKAPSLVRSVEKRSMLGRYLGSIESSNEFLPVITTLSSTSITEGVTSGKYFMSERDAIVNGEIFDCYNSAGNFLTCQWRDKYGIGSVDFIFTPDYASFNGLWSINGTEGAFKWSGLKVTDN